MSLLGVYFILYVVGMSEEACAENGQRRLWKIV